MTHRLVLFDWIETASAITPGCPYFLVLPSHMMKQSHKHGIPAEVIT